MNKVNDNKMNKKINIEKENNLFINSLIFLINLNIMKSLIIHVNHDRIENFS